MMITLLWNLALFESRVQFPIRFGPITTNGMVFRVPGITFIQHLVPNQLPYLDQTIGLVKISKRSRSFGAFDIRTT